MDANSFTIFKAIVFAIGLVILTVSQTAYAPPPLPRLALVIGNSKYKDQKLGTLRTARNDAEDIAKRLTNLGYQVSAQFDSELSSLREGITKFEEKLKTDAFRESIALIYFAGYGIQKNGRNFLLPTNFDASKESTSYNNTAIAVDLDIINLIGGREGGANVIILDACREDPFGQRQGLAQMDDVPNGTLVELAAEPNNLAIESLDPKAPERNGLFAKQLLKKLENPNPELDIRRFFDVVGNNVYEVSSKLQKPRVMTAQTTPAMPEMVSLFQENIPTRASDEELKFWRMVEKSSEICAFEQHLKRFPNGIFADSARATINAIKSKIEMAPKAFSDLPQALKAEVIQSFDNKRAQEKLECERKWSTSTPSHMPYRAMVRRGAGDFGSAEPAVVSKRFFPISRGTINPMAWFVNGRHGERLDNPFEPSNYMPAVYVFERQASPAKRGTSRQTVVADAEAVPEAAAPSVVGDEEFRSDLVGAEQGEINSMYRIALVYEEGGHEVEKNLVEMMHWRVLSSSLGNGLASYKLYRYFAAQASGYAKAVKYKSLADRQGYYGPVKLSDRR